ncbi:hypothetical protein GCM10009547_35270 [Sporichthya brevicatena]|uniref:Hydrolase n=1 Tax=Sporichthya brevicatena TaxID=171442 RepID=A0ABP3S7W5_9ACTN
MTVAQQVSIVTDRAAVAGDLVLPERADAVVVFAHGSGSSRHSPRNRMVASVLQERGIGTLLLDLLTPAEAERTFPVGLLADRLYDAERWLSKEIGPARVGYFGAGTGAAAALVAAAQARGRIGAVVSRGGRPELAGKALVRVAAPTLLIVGGEDIPVREVNERAATLMLCPRRVEIVEGATHLFGEAGALEAVAGLAADWFATFLRPGGNGV